MLFKGLMVTALSGKLDGLIASHNRGGPYFKNYCIPVDPRSTNQLICRDTMSAIASEWNGLSSGGRNAWATYARSFTTKNRLGNQRSITGRAAFFAHMFPQVQKNNALDPVGVFPTTTPPALQRVDFPFPPSMAIVSATQATLSWPTGMGWENQVSDEGQTGFIVHVSTPQPQTVNWFRGPFIPYFWVESDEDTPPAPPLTITVPTSAASHPVNFITGKRYFYTFRFWWQNHPIGSHFQGYADTSF